MLQRKRVVRGIVVDENGRILMGTRPQYKCFAGFWELPGGVIIEPETSISAMDRELLEKTNLKIDSLTFLKEMVDSETVEGVTYYIHYFLITVEDHQDFKHANPARNPQWQWFSVESMPDVSQIFGKVPFDLIQLSTAV